MSRDVTPALESYLDGPVISPFFAIELEFAEGRVLLWNGLGNLVIGDDTYIGAGNVLAISEVEETSEIQASGIKIVLSGIPSAYISGALTFRYQGRPCRVYMGVMEAPTELTEIFSGEIDQMVIEESSESIQVTATVENILIRLERPVVVRFTHEIQSVLYPGDMGLEFVAALQTREIIWGRSIKKEDDSTWSDGTSWLNQTPT